MKDTNCLLTWGQIVSIFRGMAQDTSAKHLIETIAPMLGVKPHAIKKWRQRGVPHRWRIALIEKSAGKLTPDNLASYASGKQTGGRAMISPSPAVPRCPAAANAAASSSPAQPHTLSNTSHNATGDQT